MIANYHTHTPRCMHASGTEEAYVRRAIEAGLQILGFADHTPYPFPDGYVSCFRMLPQELPDYADAVRAVQKQYAPSIEIHLGVEAEFYPKYFSDMVSTLRDNGVEYMILGQHMLGNEIGEPGCGGPTADERLLRRYCDQSIDAMHTGLFSYFAHPDLMCFTGERNIYAYHVRRLCREAKACGLPLEINLLGLRNGRCYPNPVFWEIAAEEGCDAVLGRDAHQPEALLDAAAEQQALALARRCGITPLPTIPLRKL